MSTPITPQEEQVTHRRRELDQAQVLFNQAVTSYRKRKDALDKELSDARSALTTTGDALDIARQLAREALVQAGVEPAQAIAERIRQAELRASEPAAAAGG